MSRLSFRLYSRNSFPFPVLPLLLTQQQVLPLLVTQSGNGFPFPPVLPLLVTQRQVLPLLVTQSGNGFPFPVSSAENGWKRFSVSVVVQTESRAIQHRLIII
jgi:hypothetical protein